MPSRFELAFSWTYAGLCTLGLALSGCGGGGNEPTLPASITLNATSLSFTAVGATQQLSPAVEDRQGNPLPDAAVTWTTSDSAIATVSSSGLVTAVGPGSAQVTAAAGSVSAVAQVSVVQTPAQLQKISGDGQTAVAGQAVSPPPAVQVQDANGNPVAGVGVSFEVISGRGRITAASATTNSNGIAQVGSWLLGSKGANVLQATVAGEAIGGNPATFTATGSSPFNIAVRFLGSSTPSQRQAFAAAEERWESILTGELEDVQLIANAGECGPESPALNEVVDDLVILVTVEPIDGPGDVLGSAGPCFIRVSNNLTVLGAMQFDDEDLADIEAEGLLEALILHEMGHVLGFGSLWPLQGLLQDASLPPANGADPHFTGPRAIAAFNEVGGATYSGNKVPVEDTGGEGTADGHWRESVFNNELMTGFVNAESNLLSVVTAASFADQGYLVNALAADVFSLSLAFRTSPSVARKLVNDVWRLPVRRVDRAGRVVELIRK